MKLMKLSQVLFLTLALAAVGSAVAGTHRVNGSISVAAQQQAGDVSTVNGGIAIGDHASVKAVQTVNGAVALNAGARATQVSSVNGAIELAPDAQVRGDVSVVNGAIELAKGATVGGNVSTVNGRIQLAAAHVAGGISTVNGALDIGADSLVDGDLVVRRPGNSWFNIDSRPVRVVIGPRAVVKGRLKFERPVRLYISSSARTGDISGAQAIPFVGAQPPQGRSPRVPGAIAADTGRSGRW